MSPTEQRLAAVEAHTKRQDLEIQVLRDRVRALEVKGGGVGGPLLPAPRVGPLRLVPTMGERPEGAA
jgi:hypothetical protein